jgi:hypothetical protein
MCVCVDVCVCVCVDHKMYVHCVCSVRFVCKCTMCMDFSGRPCKLNVCMLNHLHAFCNKAEKDCFELIRGVDWNGMFVYISYAMSSSGVFS